MPAFLCVSCEFKPNTIAIITINAAYPAFKERSEAEQGIIRAKAIARLETRMKSCSKIT